MLIQTKLTFPESSLPRESHMTQDNVQLLIISKLESRDQVFGSLVSQQVTAGLPVEGEKLRKYWHRVFQTQEVIRKTNCNIFLVKYSQERAEKETFFSPLSKY